jgi:hypothetical protein
VGKYFARPSVSNAQEVQQQSAPPGSSAKQLPSTTFCSIQL